MGKVKLDGRLSLKHRFSGHEEPVSYISWGPDDNQLLTCGVEEVVRRWDVNSGECIRLYEKNGLGLISCGWAPNGKRIFCGVTDQSISIWDLEGKELDCWKGHRIRRITDLGITFVLSADSRYILVSLWNQEIHLWSIEGNVKLAAIYKGQRDFLMML
ncbi:WD repeat-containing protein 26 [Datura stramonium]|uniref:WD repeat-containing protein 26 n=1 Tax=Datura stramonium TaxID=4076 RepID=A0ABS8SGD2_DATST|nr:WD repeat-containing protein 26 [Datura stramonium]